MATGASGCKVTVVLVDVSQGVLGQTWWQTAIAPLMGIRAIVFALNKVDLVGFDETAVQSVGEDRMTMAMSLGIERERVQWVPVTARDGENVVTASAQMSWWRGPTLLALLEQFDTRQDARADLPMRFPVQLVLRPDASFRGLTGTVRTGRHTVGDRLLAFPSGTQSRVERLVTFDGDLEHAEAGTPVTVVLADEIDLARGDLLVHAG